MIELARSADNMEQASQQLLEIVARLRRLADAEELRRLAGQEPAEFAADQVRRLIAARRLWRECVGAGESDPVWLLLMELFARRLEGRNATIAALAETADLAPATTYGWVARLRARGLVTRRRHPTAARAVLIDLTDEAADHLRAYLAVAARLSPSVI